VLLRHPQVGSEVHSQSAADRPCIRAALQRTVYMFCRCCCAGMVAGLSPSHRSSRSTCLRQRQQRGRRWLGTAGALRHPSSTHRYALHPRSGTDCCHCCCRQQGSTLELSPAALLRQQSCENHAFAEVCPALLHCAWLLSAGWLVGSRRRAHPAAGQQRAAAAQRACRRV
jgi:hypothetical protein